MRLDEFDYELPEDLIATRPAEPRDHSRLLDISKVTGQIARRRFNSIVDSFADGDVLVLNNTKVLPARLFGNIAAKTGEFEILLLEKKAALHWICMARPGKKVKNGLEIIFPDNVSGWITRRNDDRFEIRFRNVTEEKFLGWLSKAGVPPLPPYIKRDAETTDYDRYQTVFAKSPGSVAAPTAGLHFTPAVLEKLRAKGVEILEVTLHVGYGTFSPIRAENIKDHVMHFEDYELNAETFDRLETAKRVGRRVIAAGTTSLRVLESLDTVGRAGRTNLFVYPGYGFRRVDALITNFHLPKSSLYVLVAAFLGLERTRAAYAEAIRERYRFYSYGDAMWIH